MSWSSAPEPTPLRRSFLPISGAQSHHEIPRCTIGSLFPGEELYRRSFSFLLTFGAATDGGLAVLPAGPSLLRSR